MRDDTKLRNFRTHDTQQKLPDPVIDYIVTKEGKINLEKLRNLFSLAGIQPNSQDSELVNQLFKNADLIIAFEQNGGTGVLVAASPTGGKSPPRKRSPKRSPGKEKRIASNKAPKRKRILISS